ncbi:trigger factor [Microbulbifer agarilyticus]|uniref:trigger factor n=1 Tax=Microbulbifer agarilyticus TaxID=260552 RepID=UPI001C95E5B4|nr:trigger factor [Microbulbifer agarilyticus]MBY6212157.1 trigger factor [Microbulbifer agarilyticus]MCA0893791.1 trigger factor [Microbulbifer agarilyticus]
MQVSIETTSGLERRLTVNLPAEVVDKEVDKRLQQAAKTVRINGFRKGKVPMKVVRQRFGAGVRQEVLGEVMSRSFYDAVQKEQVKPAGQPSIEAKNVTPGENLEYVATFEVYPEVALTDLAEVAVERPTAEVTDKDVDNMIDVLRKQQSGWKETKRKAQKGDRVTIDFVGRKDGEEFEGGKAEGQQLVLGSGSMIPGFEDGILGMKPGEEKEVEVTFPEDYQAENLKGADAVFTIKVTASEKPELPELNDEFFAGYGVAEGGEEKFREEVRGNMERELKNAALNKVKTQVMDQLFEKHQVEIPAALVAGEVQTLRGQMVQQFGGQIKPEDAAKMLPDTMFEDQAKRRVVLGLVVGEIVKENKLSVDADRVKAKVEELASTYQQPEEVVEYYFNNRELLAGVESVVLEDQVVDFVLDKAKVSEVESSYDDVIKPQKQA